MEQQIQDLIASIRKEGIDSARAEADRIIQEAKDKADAIVREAEKERDKMVADAEKSIALEKSSSEAAIRQAARDVSLSLKKSIEDEYSKILSAALSKEMPCWFCSLRAYSSTMSPGIMRSRKKSAMMESASVSSDMPTFAKK